jgi:hypothetical protein
MSGETDNILISTLSAGPVGIGDAIGAEDTANLFRAVRADGVIVKPDAPLVPDDATYIADAQKKAAPLIAKTFTDHNGIRTEYVFACNRRKTPADTVRLSANNSSFVYDYFADSGRALETGAPFESPLAENGAAFYIIAPVGQSGIAFLGDKGKFVGTGKERIESLADEPGKLTVGLVLAENEKSVILHGFATAAPAATVLAGLDDAVQYNPVTHYFTVLIKPEANTPVDKSSGDPVRHVTVLLQTGAGK